MSSKKYHGALTAQGDGAGAVDAYKQRLLADIPAGLVTDQNGLSDLFQRLRACILTEGFPISPDEMEFFLRLGMDQVLPAELSFDLWEHKVRSSDPSRKSTLTSEMVKMPCTVEWLEDNLDQGDWSNHYVVYNRQARIEDARLRAHSLTSLGTGYYAEMAAGLQEALDQVSKDKRNEKPSQSAGYHIVRITDQVMPTEGGKYEAVHPAFALETMFGLMACQRSAAWPKYHDKKPRPMRVIVHGCGYIKLCPGKPAEFVPESPEANEYPAVFVHRLVI